MIQFKIVMYIDYISVLWHLMIKKNTVELCSQCLLIGTAAMGIVTLIQ